MAIDYAKLEVEARAELGPPISRLKGLLHLFTMFMVAVEVGEELRDGLDKASLWVRHAMTRTMVVEYAKAFNESREDTVKGLDRMFLGQVKAQPLHKKLIAFRNQSAAHLDSRVQPVGVGFVGIEVLNEIPTESDRFDKAFVPGLVQVNVGLALGLNNRADVEAVLEQVQRAKEATGLELNRAAEALRNVALRYPAVLDRLSDMITLHAQSPDESSHVQMPAPGEGRALKMSADGSTRTIDGYDFRELVVQWESRPSHPIHVRENGVGIVTSLGAQGSDVSFEVTFYDYS